MTSVVQITNKTSWKGGKNAPRYCDKMVLDNAQASQLAPDHPLLQQAQAALTYQLEERKLYLEEQLRERSQGLKVRGLA